MSNNKSEATWGHHDPAVKPPQTTPILQREEPQTLMPLQYVERVGDKRESVAFPWMLFFGAQGAHLFYLGRPGKAIAYLFTLGFLGIGVLVDIFTLRDQVARANGWRVGA